jgi:hypothetical protein
MEEPIIHKHSEDAIAASQASGGSKTYARWSHDNWTHLFERCESPIVHHKDGSTVYQKAGLWRVELLHRSHPERVVALLVEAITRRYHADRSRPS